MSFSLSEQERAEKYYAFNINKFKQGHNKKKKFNFDNIKKGFYDDLITYDKQLKKDKIELNETKTKGFKETVYSNVKMPDVWRNKITYQSDLYNTMNEDKFFVSYLGTGGNKMYISPERKTPITPNITQNINQNIRKTVSSTSYDKSFTKKEEPHHISFNFKELIKPMKQKLINKSILRNSPQKERDKDKENVKDIVYKEDESVDYEEEKKRKKIQKEIEKEKEIKKSKAYLDFIKNTAKENRRVLSILEEYKQAFPIDLPKINYSQRKSKIENKINLTEAKEDINSPFKPKNYIILNEKEKNVRPIHTSENNIRKKKGELTKAEVFKTTIYNNLLNKNTNKKEDHLVTLKDYRDILDNEIEIHEPEIKKKLEDINYYGPFYPYCFIGRRKNMLFYKTMEYNQCITLLNYLRKMRNKPTLGIKVEQDEDSED